MTEGKRSTEYNKGYTDAQQDLLDKENINLFKEGYKAGFRDGYIAAIKEISSKFTENIPPEFKDKLGDDAQPWIWPW